MSILKRIGYCLESKIFLFNPNPTKLGPFWKLFDSMYFFFRFFYRLKSDQFRFPVLVVPVKMFILIGLELRWIRGSRQWKWQNVGYESDCIENQLVYFKYNWILNNFKRFLFEYFYTVFDNKRKGQEWISVKQTYQYDIVDSVLIGTEKAND